MHALYYFLSDKHHRQSVPQQQTHVNAKAPKGILPLLPRQVRAELLPRLFYNRRKHKHGQHLRTKQPGIYELRSTDTSNVAFSGQSRGSFFFYDEQSNQLPRPVTPQIVYLFLCHVTTDKEFTVDRTTLSTNHSYSIRRQRSTGATVTLHSALPMYKLIIEGETEIATSASV